MQRDDTIPLAIDLDILSTIILKRWIASLRRAVNTPFIIAHYSYIS